MRTILVLVSVFLLLALMPAAVLADNNICGLEFTISGHKVVASFGEQPALTINGVKAKPSADDKMLRAVLSKGLVVALSAQGLEKDEYNLTADYSNGSRLTTEVRHSAQPSAPKKAGVVAGKVVTIMGFRIEPESDRLYKYFCQMTPKSASPSVRIVELTKSAKITGEFKEIVRSLKIRRAK